MSFIILDKDKLFYMRGLKELTSYQEERRMQELFLKHKNGKCNPRQHCYFAAGEMCVVHNRIFNLFCVQNHQYEFIKLIPN